MRPYERNGVTVDQCTECRGLFLDRGELERLVDAENDWHAAPAPHREYERSGGRGHRRDPDSGEYPVHRGRKSRSFLSDLFD